MDTTDTFVRLKTWLAAELNIREELITPEATLDDLFWEKQGTPPDSMDIVEFVMEFDKDYHIEVSEGDFESSSPFLMDGNTTVQEIVELIEKKMKA